MIINGNVIKSDEGKWLYNGEVCSQLVFLGKNASADEWTEVDHYIEQGENPNIYTAEQLAEMTNAELSAILADMGVSAVMDKDNMIDLILYKQKGE